MYPFEWSSAPRWLVLWDVDHTLVETRGVGFAIYQRAFPTATGRALDKLTEVSGRTELDIMRETLEIHGIAPTDEAVAKLATALVNGYESAREELASIGGTLPGAKTTLERLAAEPQIHQGVLTGNLREVARVKLEVFGLSAVLDLSASAYGDDHSDRAKLVKIAQSRASHRTGNKFDSRNTVLIGDTPRDVEAALRAGVRVIAVASGRNDGDALRAAGASVVIQDLADPERVCG